MISVVDKLNLGHAPVGNPANKENTMLQIERLSKDIAALGDLAQERQQQNHDDISTAKTWLQQAPPPEEIRRHTAQLANAEKGWSGALPVSDTAVNATLPLKNGPLQHVKLIAVDGSQIFTDHHAAVPYYLIQVGGIVFKYNQQAPKEHSEPSLYYTDKDLYDARGYLIGSEQINQRRMLHEMAYLAEISALETPSAETVTFALTDGPLQWPYVERSRADRLALDSYLDSLGQVQKAGGVPVGYVDRPGGRALIEMLWAMQLPAESLKEEVQNHPLRFLTDQHLMTHVLKSGEHTPWFTRPTATNRNHANAGQEIWFCYVNVGRSTHPVIARVEQPSWAVENRSNDILHSALHHQAQVLNGYPYVLARAHEIALVSTKDKQVLDNILQRQFLKHGFIVRSSEKARQKSYLGKR